tara:strand:+ start:381 stop:716 length:336 start_codon:yes stop_codon:yes gene_type:complete
LDKIVFERRERPIPRTETTNHDDIKARLNTAWQNIIDTRTQSASGAIALHGIADFSAGRKADSHHICTVFAWASGAYLHHHTRCCPFTFTASRRQEISATLDAVYANIWVM